jgi:hypothetical protein
MNFYFHNVMYNTMKEPPDLNIDTSKFTTVKSTLNQFCNNNFIKQKLNLHVLNCNKLIFEVYKFANLHLLRCFRDNETLPVLDQSFFYKCSTYVSEMYLRKSQNNNTISFDKTFDIYKLQRPKDYKPAYRDNLGSIINYLDKQMVISTINQLVLNFYKRFSRYIKDKYELDNKTVYEICKAVYDKEYKGENEIVKKYRTILDNKPPYEKFIKKDPTKILKIYNEILTFNIQNNKKLFSLIPNKNGFTMNYINIDKTGLKDILVSIKLQNFSREHFDKHTTSYWNRFFNIQKFQTINKKFHSFLTDGVSVSILLEKTNTENVIKIKPKEFIYQNQELIALDPGLRMLFVGCNNKDNTIISCSGKSYYHDTGINRINYKQRRHYNKDEIVLSYIRNMPIGKTNDITEFCKHLRYCLNKLDPVLEFHYKNPFRKWHFTKYILEKKKINELCQLISKKRDINEPSKVVVGFGDWSNPHDSIIRGHKRGPVLKLKKHLQKWCKVIDVNEFRTSKLCCKCHNETEKVSYNGVKVNSVLRCCNNECGMIIDRDINGCKNILKMLMVSLNQMDKPEVFKRTNKSLPSLAQKANLSVKVKTL